MKDRLLAMRAKLDALKTLDRGMKVFGAAYGTFGHFYREAPPLRDRDVALLEQRLGVELPEEYRALVTSLHGGGAGPFYGLVAPGSGHGYAPTTPFAWTARDADAILERRRTEDQWAMLPRADGDIGGMIMLADQGCGWESALVVNGELRGHVWTVGEAYCPAGKSVLDWYEQWLDASLEPGAFPIAATDLMHLPDDAAGVNLAQNELTTWPPRLDSLTELRVLVLDTNQLATLSPALGKMTKLERLSAGWNRLTALPESIGECHALEHVMLKSNTISALPESIGRCTKLKYLCLDFNPLTSLPASIASLGALETLALQYCTGLDLDDVLAKTRGLPKLRVLDVSSCNATDAWRERARVALPNVSIVA